MPEITKLKTVNLREVWPHEAHNFTPWLAENIDQLGEAVGLRLKDVEIEKTLGDMGRVDIFAKQEETDEIVVIENQIEPSDGGHCVSLIGYAAGAEANILVWVASDFDPYYEKIIRWLNESDTINVYAVKVVAYCVKGNYTYEFRTVVVPESYDKTSYSKPKTSNTLYAEFYRPLRRELILNGFKTVGRGGWQGRWRSFDSGIPDVVYATRAEDGNVHVFLSVNRKSNQKIFTELKEYQDDIYRELGREVLWKEFDNDWSRIILESTQSFSLTASEVKLENTRQWMLENLIILRKVLEPYLSKFRPESVGKV